MNALGFLLQTIRIAVPYLLAAAGGVMSERVGIIALGLEGLMLSGAFGAAIGSYYGGSAWVGLLGAIVAGLLITGILAVATLRFRANQVVVGVAGKSAPLPNDGHGLSASATGFLFSDRKGLSFSLAC